jgi:hypothetical protein
VALAFGVSILVPIWRLGMRRWGLVLALLGAGASLALLSLFSTEAHARIATVSIQQPPNGARIDSFHLRVEGIVAPASSVVTLLVRSESDDRWWVQDVVRADPKSGKWLIDAYVGTPTEGVHQSFTLIALASDDDVLFNLLAGRHLRRGMVLGTVPPWNRSALRVVWRAR